jgi:hypothetical protein
LIALCAALTAACNAPQQQDAPATLTQAALPIADEAGNRMEALALSEDQTRWCSADGVWCVRAGETPHVVHGDRSITLPSIDAAETAVWPVIIRFANDESALVGLARTAHQMYSGGGGDATHVALFEVADDAGVAAREALTLPTSGSVSIRACFDPEDEQARRGACLDEYKFESRATIDETVNSGAPRIVLETAASTYPGRRSRQEDSTEAPPLQESDLSWTGDETCSYRRVFTRGADGAYAPDQPLPECADYLEP